MFATPLGLSCRQCSAHQLSALAALRHPSSSPPVPQGYLPPSTKYLESVTIALFLVLIGGKRPSATSELRTNHLIVQRRAKCSSDADIDSTGKHETKQQNQHRTSKIELRKWWSDTGSQLCSTFGLHKRVQSTTSWESPALPSESRFRVKGLEHTIILFCMQAAPRCGFIKNR